MAERPHLEALVFFVSCSLINVCTSSQRNAF
nr:MAG TPA_asm: hypothetical protein [Caudoviricetes sp.]